MKSFYAIPPSEWLTPPGFIHPQNFQEGQLRREEIRQWLLRECLFSYEYPSYWITKRIIFDFPIVVANNERFIDIAILNPLGDPFLLILITEKDNLDTVGGVNDQMRSFMTRLASVSWGIASNGTTCSVFHKNEKNQIVRENRPPRYISSGTSLRTKEELLKLKRLTAEEAREALIHLINYLNLQGFRHEDVLIILLQILFLKFNDEQRTKNEYLLFQEGNFGNPDEFFSTLVSFYDKIQKQFVKETGRGGQQDQWTLQSQLLRLPADSFYRIWKDHVQDIVFTESFDCHSLVKIIDDLFCSLAKDTYIFKEEQSSLRMFLLLLQKENKSQKVLDLTACTGDVLVDFLSDFVDYDQHTLFNDYSLFYTLSGVESSFFLGQLIFLKLWLLGYRHPIVSLKSESSFSYKIPDNFFSHVVGLYPYSVYDNEEELLEHALNSAKIGGRLSLLFSNDFLSNPDMFSSRKKLLEQCRIYGLIGFPFDFGYGKVTMVLAKKISESQPKDALGYVYFDKRDDSKVFIANIETASENVLTRIAEQFLNTYPDW